MWHTCVKIVFLKNIEWICSSFCCFASLWHNYLPCPLLWKKLFAFFFAKEDDWLVVNDHRVAVVVSLFLEVLVQHVLMFVFIVIAIDEVLLRNLVNLCRCWLTALHIKRECHGVRRAEEGGGGFWGGSEGGRGHLTHHSILVHEQQVTFWPEYEFTRLYMNNNKRMSEKHHIRIFGAWKRLHSGKAFQYI